jgi:hypothetical protein
VAKNKHFDLKFGVGVLFITPKDRLRPLGDGVLKLELE